MKIVWKAKLGRLDMTERVSKKAVKTCEILKIDELKRSLKKCEPNRHLIIIKE